MTWTLHYFNPEVKALVTASEEDGGLLDAGQKADHLRALNALREHGPAGITAKLSKSLGGGLYEFRLNGEDGIARVFYCFLKGQRLWYLHALIKKTQKTPAKDLKLAQERMKEVKAYDAEQERKRREQERLRAGRRRND
ncbi:MAG TPA: type II toxin-antitoxin system RelE/ParE family toxin [Oscillatoriaceae cyanobacterium]